MSLWSRLRLNFPIRIALFIGVVIILILWLGFSSFLGIGTLSISVDKPNGYIVMNGERHDTPYQAQLRTGRRTVTIGATGYVEKVIKVTVPAFRMKKQYHFSLTEELFYDEDEDSSIEEQAIQKYPWVSQLPYRTDDFEIYFPAVDGTFTVVLAPLSVVIPGANPAEVRKDVVQAKEKALAWIRSVGTDPVKLKIEWLPYDPAVK